MSSRSYFQFDPKPYVKSRTIWPLRPIVLLAGMLMVSLPSFGQTYDLIPENWFPLEVGSYWHYEFLNQAFLVDVVHEAVADTTVDGQRWVGISEVFCNFPPNCPDELPSSPTWYHFTEDHYLLVNYDPEINIATADTMVATAGQSVFSVTTSPSTLSSPHVSNPVVVSISPNNDEGNASDSTNLTLEVDGGSIFFDETFIYKIGLASPGSEPSGVLVGAYVGGVVYGDTTLINDVILPVEEEFPPPLSTFELYPNPSSGVTTLEVVANSPGRYDITLYNTLGQVVFRVAKPLQIGQTWRYTLDASWLPSALYLIRLERDDITLESKQLILLQ